MRLPNLADVSPKESAVILTTRREKPHEKTHDRDHRARSLPDTPVAQLHGSDETLIGTLEVPGTFGDTLESGDDVPGGNPSH